MQTCLLKKLAVVDMRINPNITIRVANIIDGDTIKGSVSKVLRLSENESSKLFKACRTEDFKNCSLTVRFAVIDSLEIDQALGIQAQGFLKQVIKESQGIVSLELADVDRYGRLVAFCQGTEDLNLMMVGHGYAVPNFTYLNRYVTDDRHQETYEAYATAQYNATIKRMGMWGLKAPVMPADFRRNA